MSTTLTYDRRRRRSDDVSDALFYQLDACRSDAGLAAMILADWDGLCIAASAPQGDVDELAARAAMFGRRAEVRDTADSAGDCVDPGAEVGADPNAEIDIDGELWTDSDRLPVHVRRFALGDTDLCLCAVGGSTGDRTQQIERSLMGVRRILAV